MPKPTKTKSRKRSIILRVVAIFGVIVLTLGGVGWYLVWQLNQSMSNQGSGCSENWPHVLAPPNEDQAEYDEVFEALLTDYPDLAPDWKDVPDEQNGFLQLLNLSEYITGANGADAEYIIELPLEFRKSLSGDDFGDEPLVDEASMDLLLEELCRIGELNEQSCAHIDKNRFLFPKLTFIRGAVNLLLEEAKDAAFHGEKERALQYVYAASGIVKHLSQIEAMSLIGATIAIVCELKVADAVFVEILPSIETDQADLRKLRTVLAENKDAFIFSKLMKGEFNMATPNLMMPTIENAKLCQLIGKDRIYRAIANYNVNLLNSFKDQPEFVFLDSEKTSVIFKTQRGKAPFLERSIQDFFSIGVELFMKGAQRVFVMRSRGDAAFAYLLGEEIPMEPITGKPYVLDEQAKILLLPNDPLLADMEREPLQLPY